jgi:hypothetical protein
MTAEVRSANGRSRSAAHAVHGTRALPLIRPEGGGAIRAMSNHVHVRSLAAELGWAIEGPNRATVLQPLRCGRRRTE